MLSKIFLTFLFALCSIRVWSQETTNAFFIFNKDKSVTPYFFSEVKKLNQTESFVNGELCKVTEIWTQDTVYTIPVETIDSISFVTPPTIRKPNSHELSDQVLSYLVSADSLTLAFSKDIPDELLPHVDDNITRSAPTKALPYGFLGKVKAIHSSNESLIVDCDSIGLGDAFVRLYQAGGFTAESPKFKPEQTHSTRSGYEPPHWNDFVIKPIKKDFLLPPDAWPTFSEEIIENLSFGITPTLYASFTVAPKGKYMVTFEEGFFHPSITLDMTCQVETQTNYAANLSMSLDIDQFLVKNFFELDGIIPVPYTFGLLRYEVRPDIELSGDIAFECSSTEVREFSFYTHFSKNPNFKNTFRIKPTVYSKPTSRVTMFSGSFDFFTGVYGGIYLGWRHLRAKKRWFSMGVRAGYDLNWKWKVGLEEFSTAQNTTWLYDQWKTEEIASTKFVVEPTVGCEFGNNSISFGLPFTWPHKPLGSKKIFPVFNLGMYKHDSKSPNINYLLSEDLFFPVNPGIVIMDDNDTEVYSAFSDKTYTNSDDVNFFSFPYRHNVVNRKYKAYPAFTIFGRRILASPYIPLFTEAIPRTLHAEAYSDCASLFGVIEIKGFSDDPESYDWTDTEYGFVYSQSKGDLQYNGNKKTCEKDEANYISAYIDGLVPERDYFYCAYIATGDTILYGDIETFRTEENEEVDLGLSVNWRNCNLGSVSSSDRGALFAWGELVTKSSFSWQSYFDDPYGASDEWVGCKINQDISGNSTLDATTTIEGGWRMPTRTEMQELVEKCDWKWESRMGVNGYKVTGPSSKSIFLPATGLGDKDSVNSPDQYGAYWTSTPQLDTEGKATAATLYFYGDRLKSLQWANRYGGRAIRPVKSK